MTLGMHNGPDTLFNTIKFLKKPELAPLEKPFKLTFLNGKVFVILTVKCYSKNCITE